MSTYRSKSISLADDVWDGFDRLREVHGSYNKALRFVLSAGGVFDSPTEKLIQREPKLALKLGDNLISTSLAPRRGVRPKGDKTR